MIRRLSCSVVLLPLAACNATAVDSATQQDQPNGADWEVFDLGGDMIVVPSKPNDDDEVDVTEVHVTEPDPPDPEPESNSDPADDDDLGPDEAPEPAAYQLEWVYQWGTAHDDGVTDLAPDAQEGVVVAIRTVSNNTQLEEFRSHTLLRFDTSGDLSWSASHEDSGDVSAAEYIAVAPNGDIYGVGVVEGESTDLRLTRFDALGSSQWSYEWGSDGTDTPTAIAVDNAGNILVAGNAEGPLSGSTDGEGGAFLTMFDDAAEIVWQRQFGADDESVTTLAFSGDGGVVAGTIRNLRVGDIDSSVLGFDSSGAVAWTQDWATPEDVVFDAMTLDGSGAIFVGGGSNDSTGFTKPLLAKLDTRGELAWSEAWDAEAPTWIRGVAALADGGIALATTSAGTSLDWSGIVIIDADGNRADPLRLEANRSTRVHHLVVDSTDDLFMAGTTEGNLTGTWALFGDAFVAKFTRVE